MSRFAIIMRAFLDGFTGASLFRRLDYPCAPTEFSFIPMAKPDGSTRVATRSECDLRSPWQGRA